MKPSTPATLASRITHFLKKAGLKEKLTFLPFTFMHADYKHGYCLSNCEAEAKRSKSVIIYGWTIWESKKDEFIEAEFHSVMKKGGNLIDITPRINGEELILFIPDSGRTASRLNETTWQTWGNIKSHSGIIYEFCTELHIRDLDSNIWQI